MPKCITKKHNHGNSNDLTTELSITTVASFIFCGLRFISIQIFVSVDGTTILQIFVMISHLKSHINFMKSTGEKRKGTQSLCAQGAVHYCNPVVRNKLSFYITILNKQLRSRTNTFRLIVIFYITLRKNHRMNDIQTGLKCKG